MGQKRQTALRKVDFDAPVAEAAGKRIISRPLRLLSDDELPTAKRRVMGKAGEKAPRIKADKRDNEAAQIAQKNSGPVIKKRRSSLQRRDGPREQRIDEDTEGIKAALFLALKDDLEPLNGEPVNKPPVAANKPVLAYKLRKSHLTDGQDMGARIPDLDPTPSELEVAQALSSWNEEPSAELDDHKMLRADSTLELLSEDDGDLAFSGGACGDSPTSTGFNTAVCGDKSPSASELQNKVLEETPVPLTPAVHAARGPSGRCRSRKGKNRKRRQYHQQKKPARAVSPPMTRRRANNHAVQEEPGHSSHARAANSVSDASDDYDNDEAVLSEGAALRTSEDIATPERVGQGNRRKSLPVRLPQGIGNVSRTMIGPDDHLGKSMLQARLENCLQPRSRRWVTYEFFCSAIDRPFFMRSEFFSYLRRIGIPPATKLTRIEWDVVRSFCVKRKPRRLSAAFLEEERIRLEVYRRTVRQAYASQGAGAEISSDLPRPLKVSQRVVARHPHNRQLLDGKILTVSSDSYRVQFDRREQGVQLVRDVDIMPSDPSENLPPSLVTIQPPALVNGRIASTAAVRNQAMRVVGNTFATAPARSSSDVPPMSQVSPRSVDVKGKVFELEQRSAEIDNEIKRLETEMNNGSHTVESGRLSDSFQKAYSELHLAKKTVGEQLRELRSQLPLCHSSSPTSPALLSPQGSTSYLTPVQKRQIPGFQQMLPVVNPLPTWPDIQSEASRVLKTARMERERQQKRQAITQEEKTLSSVTMSASEQAQISKEANAKHVLLTGCSAAWVILYKAAAVPMPPQDVKALLEKAFVLMEPKHAASKQTIAKIQQTLTDILKPYL